MASYRKTIPERRCVNGAKLFHELTGSGDPLVLVHGGWHGAWCWGRVTAILRAAGHEVHAPTLTGLGERAHLLTPEVGLDTHVQDVVDVLTNEELSGVILVGHSYGGMVVAGVADRAADRIAHLVFLDAFVPEDGQSLFDLLLPERRELYLQGARERSDSWRVPPPPAQALGLTDEAEARRLDAKLTPQSLRTFQQPVRLSNPEAEALPRTYIHCTAGPLTPSFAPFAQRFRETPGWRHHELASGHDVMLIEPEALCDMLLALLRQERRILRLGVATLRQSRPTGYETSRTREHSVPLRHTP